MVPACATRAALTKTIAATGAEISLTIQLDQTIQMTLGWDLI